MRSDLTDLGGANVGGGGSLDVFARSIIVINAADGGHKSLREALTLRRGAIGASLLWLVKADVDAGVGVGVNKGVAHEALVVTIKP